MLLLGMFEIVIGILAFTAGLLAPDTVLFGNIGILQLLGFFIGVIAIVVGALAVANAIGIPLGILSEVLTVPFQLRFMTYLAAGKAILCILCLMWVLGSSFTWTSFTFYLFATLIDFGLAFYGRSIINWIMARAPPRITKLRLKF
jgi:hypothetical protein